MELCINPPDALDTLACLNACFPGWGDERFFKWVYQRAMRDQPPPDYLVLKEGGSAVAGSGISYRQVVLPNERVVTAGIMTGSWTMPEARGRGCFSRMITESIHVTADRGGALLLAFVTEDNPSCRQLLKAGAAGFPTWYLNSASNAVTTQSEDQLQEVTSISAELFQGWLKRREGFVRYGYGSLEDWYSQMIMRPAKTVLLQRADAFAVLEERPDTYRLLAYLEPERETPIAFVKRVRDYASQKGKKLFLFSANAPLFQDASKEGFVEKPGFITAHVVNWERLALALSPSAWGSGLSHTVVADESSLWFLGHWSLQSGDRM